MEKSEKRQRFEKVASNRVQKIIDFLNLLIILLLPFKIIKKNSYKNKKTG